MPERLRRISQGVLSDSRWRGELTFVLTAAITVVAASGSGRTLATALLLLVALGCYVAAVRGPEGLRQVALTVCVLAGLLAIVLAPRGLAEWPVLLAAVHLRTAFAGDAALVVTGVTGVAFGLVIFGISGSAVGLLAGVGVPILAQRRVDQLALQAERDRAVRLLAELEAARDAQAEAAALEERGKIAREMHDVLAHSLAGLSLQLQAARAVAARENAGPAVLEPLDRAAELARSGLEEARSAVGALRGPLRTNFSSADVQALVDRFPGSAALFVTGEPQTLSAAAGHAIYRAVQESLTNATRYAPGSPVRVVMQWGATQLRVLMVDDGPGGDPVPGGQVSDGQGTGLGLTGMRERVEAVGGQLVTGPDGAGWKTEIVMPVPTQGGVT